MTRSEAKAFILATIQLGESLDLYQVMRTYQGKTLREALEEYFGDIAPYCDIDRIVKESGMTKDNDC